MDDHLRNMTMKDIGAMMTGIDQFIKMYIDGSAMLLDIRYPFETELLGFDYYQGYSSE